MLEILVICMGAAQTRDFWQKAFTTIAHRHQNNLSIQSTDTQWPGRFHLWLKLKITWLSNNAIG